MCVYFQYNSFESVILAHKRITMNSRSWMVSATVRRTGDLPQHVAYAVKGKYLLKILEDCGVKSETNDSGNADTDFERMVEKLTGSGAGSRIQNVRSRTTFTIASHEAASSSCWAFLVPCSAFYSCA